MVGNIVIHPDQFGYLIILDGTITIPVNEELIIGEGLTRPHIRIESGHPSGPVLCYYSLKAVISAEDATRLNNIGVQVF